MPRELRITEPRRRRLPRHLGARRREHRHNHAAELAGHRRRHVGRPGANRGDVNTGAGANRRESLVGEDGRRHLRRRRREVGAPRQHDRRRRHRPVQRRHRRHHRLCVPVVAERDVIVVGHFDEVVGEVAVAGDRDMDVDGRAGGARRRRAAQLGRRDVRAVDHVVQAVDQLGVVRHQRPRRIDLGLLEAVRAQQLAVRLSVHLAPERREVVPEHRDLVPLLPHEAALELFPGALDVIVARFRVRVDRRVRGVARHSARQVDWVRRPRHLERQCHLGLVRRRHPQPLAAVDDGAARRVVVRDGLAGMQVLELPVVEPPRHLVKGATAAHRLPRELQLEDLDPQRLEFFDRRVQLHVELRSRETHNLRHRARPDLPLLVVVGVHPVVVRR